MVALGMAVSWLVALVAFFLPAPPGPVSGPWQPISLIMVGGLNAFSAGTIALEMICWVFPGRLNEKKYSFASQVLFGVFLMGQTAAYLILINA
jgi:hypothetical protein